MIKKPKPRGWVKTEGREAEKAKAIYRKLHILTSLTVSAMKDAMFLYNLI